MEGRLKEATDYINSSSIDGIVTMATVFISHHEVIWCDQGGCNITNRESHYTYLYYV